MYNQMITIKVEVPTSEMYFSTCFEDQNLDWQFYYKMPFICTIDTYSRSFQMKVLHNIIYTNEKLYRIGKVESAMCTFCNRYIETLNHLFYDCTFVQQFWKNVNEIFLKKLIDVVLTAKDVILGFKSEHNDGVLFNHLLIMGKQCIYTARMKNVKPEITGFKNKVAYINAIERRIARNKGKLNIHVKKWEKLN